MSGSISLGFHGLGAMSSGLTQTSLPMLSEVVVGALIARREPLPGTELANVQAFPARCTMRGARSSAQMVQYHWPLITERFGCLSTALTLEYGVQRISPSGCGAGPLAHGHRDVDDPRPVEYEPFSDVECNPFRCSDHSGQHVVEVSISELVNDCPECRCQLPRIHHLDFLGVKAALDSDRDLPVMSVIYPAH